MSWPRSPSSRDFSRSSWVSRLSWTRVALVKLLDAGEFTLDQGEFHRLGVLLRDIASRLLFELLDAPMQLLLLANARGATEFGELGFASHHMGDVGGARARQQLVTERDLVAAVALAFEPRLARGKLVETLGHDREVGARDRVVEPNQNVAGLDVIAVANAQLPDGSPGRVLNLLHVGVDDDRALGNDGAGKVGRRSPAADTDRQNHGRHGSDQKVMANR
jgi:hypothetical protein